MIFLGSMWSLWYCGCFRLKGALFSFLFSVGFMLLFYFFIWFLGSTSCFFFFFFCYACFWFPWSYDCHIYLFFLFTPNLKLCSAPCFLFFPLYLMFLFHSIYLFFLSCLSCSLILLFYDCQSWNFVFHSQAVASCEIEGPDCSLLLVLSLDMSNLAISFLWST